jgi:hypothetical protein
MRRMKRRDLLSTLSQRNFVLRESQATEEREMRIVSGTVGGLVLSGAFGYLLAGVLLGGDVTAGLIVAAIFGAIGAVYSAIAFYQRVYELGFLSILGYLMDLTWSMLNTIAGFLVWAPACLATGASLNDTDSQSRRSGCFVYNRNPRGGEYAATTVGTVIGGGWSSHEEVHVWQARIFGPAYMACYGLSFLLNLIFRLATFRTASLVFQAYERVCFEDWAYWGGALSGPDISWGGWIGGFLATTLFIALTALIPVGAVMGEVAIVLVGIGGLCVYSLIRALLPAGH